MYFLGGKLTDHQIEHETIIKIDNVSKDFVVGKNTVNALEKINLLPKKQRHG